MGVFLVSFSLQMGQLSDPVATHPRTNEVEVPSGFGAPAAPSYPNVHGENPPGC